MQCRKFKTEDRRPISDGVTNHLKKSEVASSGPLKKLDRSLNSEIHQRNCKGAVTIFTCQHAIPTCGSRNLIIRQTL